jgi:hypothetical protein
VPPHLIAHGCTEFAFLALIDQPILPQSAAATYFVPAPLMPQIERCRDAMSALDASTLDIPPDTDGEACGGSSRARKSLIRMKLVPVSAGDEIQLKGMKYGSKTRFVAMTMYRVIPCHWEFTE